MNLPLLTWKKFNDPEQAREVAELLEKAGITYSLENMPPVFDPSFAFNQVEPDIALKLPSKSFQSADECLYRYHEEAIKDAPPDYHLFSFSDAELRDLVSKPDEWGHFDYLLARRILSERGADITENEIKEIKKDRMRDLSSPSNVSKGWLVLSYLAAVFFGVFGIFMGWPLAYAKKNLPDGSRVYEYDANTRMHGRIIFYLALVTTAYWVLDKLYISHRFTG